MATFYTGVDKSIYQGGDHYIPMEKFRLNPYEQNNLSYESSQPKSYGITNTNAFTNSGGGGGGNYRTDYKPNYEYRQYVDGYDPNLTATMNMKMMEMDPNYKGPDYYNEPAPTGLAKGINTAINFIPYIGTMKRGVEFLGDAFGKYMPVNQRAIMENELRGAGVYTDDIGRIVAGEGGYNTPEGIMAGYNANQMTEKTFDKRTGNITEALAEKAEDLGLDISKEQLAAIAKDIEETGTYTGEYTDETFGAKNLFSNLVNVNKAKFNFFETKKKADDIYEWEKQQKEDSKNTTTTTDQNQTGGGDYTPPTDQGQTGSWTPGGTYTAPAKQRDYSTHHAYGLKDGGRIGLRYGGLLSIL